MRKIIVTEFVTLDGVMEDPGGAEKFARGGWAFQFERGAEGDKYKIDDLFTSDALLLGRGAYQGFAAAWPLRTGEFADKPIYYSFRVHWWDFLINKFNKRIKNSRRYLNIGSLNKSHPG